MKAIQSLYDIEWGERVLIEASAGTGKTYTLAALYVRLLVEKGLDVDQILVMTFTKKATSELRERIFNRLIECLHILEGEVNEKNDTFLNDFKASVDDLSAVSATLRKAIRNFDDSQVFTIHGFCQKILREEALMAGTPFEVEVIQQDDLLTQATEDFWREFLNRHSETEAGRYYITKLLNIAGTPHELKDKLEILFSKPYANREGSGLEKPVEYLDKVLSLRQEMVELWEVERSTIEQELLECGLKYYTESNVRARVREMQKFIEDSVFSIEKFNKLIYFTSRHVSNPENLKKNETRLPDHDFFKISDQYYELIGDINKVKTSIIEEAYSRISDIRNRLSIDSNTATYDDLIINVRNALMDPDRGEELSNILNEKYPFALVDEFQDTDPIQYSIFDSMYSPGRNIDSGLVMIGDPKQAIYAFRGADVHAYLLARDSRAVTRYTLKKNFRSTPTFNKAVNTVFEYTEHPFIEEGIEYLQIESGKPELESKFLIDGKPGSGVRIVAKRGVESNKEASKEFAFTQTVTEIADLLEKAESGEVQVGDSVLKAGDIAVLVSTHRDAEEIKRRLKRLGVDSVTYSRKKVFETAEARRMEALMSAVLDPYNRTNVNNALISGFWGQNLNRIYEWIEDGDNREDLVEELQKLSETWHRDGFYPMFRKALFLDEKITELASISNSERILTNLYQLADICSKAEREGKLDPHALRSWFAGEMADPGKDEEKTLLLESDQNLVKISTIHNSKGLEYPVVFCPTLWDARSQSDNFLIEYHKKSGKAAIRIDQDENEDQLLAAERSNIEKIAEEIRKCYVAITRAKYRCVLTWVSYEHSAKSGFGASLLGSQTITGFNDKELKLRSGNEFSGETFLQIFRELNESSADAIELEILDSPKQRSKPVQWTWKEADSLSFSSFNGRQRLEVQQDIESFSSLTHHADPGEPDYDQLMESYISAVQEDREEIKKRTIFSFPKGATAGTAIHKIFEDDIFHFDTAGLSNYSDLIENVLTRYGIDSAWTPVIKEMIENVVLSKIPGLNLGEVNETDQLREMEFHVLVKKPSLENILEIIRNDSDATLSKAQRQSFLTGFIDLVVRQNGLYYIIDYKSNHLGDAAEDYNQDRLRKEIFSASYDVQYHLYTVALIKYLTSRLPDFDYERDFGGVAYLFVRGMRKGESSGIWFHKPGVGLIRRLEKELEVQV